MPSIDVQTEQELNRGWLYRVLIRHDSGACTQHDVRLSWVDHDHWSGGRLAPSIVVQRVVEYLLTHGPLLGGGDPAFLPSSFDAARARRWAPAIDEELRAAG